MKMSVSQLASLTYSPSEDKSLQTCQLVWASSVWSQSDYPQDTVCTLALFAVHLYILGDFFPVPVSVFGCRNNLRSSVGHADQFPQLHISISKCQTTLWLPVHLSLPVHTLLLLMRPDSPLVPEYLLCVHFTSPIRSKSVILFIVIHITHSLLVIPTGYGCGEWPGDSADDWYRGARHGQLCPEPGGVSEGPDLHTDTGTSVSYVCQSRAIWLKSLLQSYRNTVLVWFYT